MAPSTTGTMHSGSVAWVLSSIRMERNCILARRGSPAPTQVQQITSAFCHRTRQSSCRDMEKKIKDALVSTGHCLRTLLTSKQKYLVTNSFTFFPEKFVVQNISLHRNEQIAPMFADILISNHMLSSKQTHSYAARMKQTMSSSRSAVRFRAL